MREFVEEITGGRGRRRNEEDRQDRIGKDRRGITSKYISSLESLVEPGGQGKQRGTGSGMVSREE